MQGLCAGVSAGVIAGFECRFCVQVLCAGLSAGLSAGVSAGMSAGARIPHGCHLADGCVGRGMLAPSLGVRELCSALVSTPEREPPSHASGVVAGLVASAPMAPSNTCNAMATQVLGVHPLKQPVVQGARSW